MTDQIQETLVLQVIFILDAYRNDPAGRTNSDTGRAQEALAAYKEAAKHNTNLARAHYSLGIIYANSDDQNGELSEYELVKKSDANLANDLFNAIYGKN